MYIYQLQDWPRFTWNREQLAELLAAVRHRQGRLIGHMEALGFNLRQEADTANPDGRRAQKQRDRGGEVGR